MGETYLSERRLGAALTPARPAGSATIAGGPRATTATNMSNVRPDECLTFESSNGDAQQ